MKHKTANHMFNTNISYYKRTIYMQYQTHSPNINYTKTTTTTTTTTTATIDIFIVTHSL